MRLYSQNELEYRKQEKNSNKLEEQYLYAKETMEFLESAINDSRNNDSGSSEQTTNWKNVGR